MSVIRMRGLEIGMRRIAFLAKSREPLSPIMALPRRRQHLPILWAKEPPDLMMKKLEGYDPKHPDEYLNLLNGHKTPEDLAGSVLDRVREMLVSSLGLNREPTRD
jgi:hypothetical protein